jgi:hypothetical protein
MNKIFLGKEIPGMIETCEQILLQECAKNINFDQHDIVTEFGTFFGRSTSCISAGLKENDSFNNKRCRFYAYDSFECDLSGGFYPHVYSFAKQSNLENCLEIKGSTVSFYPIFKYYLDYYIKSEILFPEKEELKNSFPKGECIKLMHIDSPKFYNEFKFILYRFFPRLKIGSFIVFQDFYYHWSATLIAVIGMMVKEGFLSFEKSAASSLLCIVKKPFNLEEINKINLAMYGGGSTVAELIDFAIEMSNKNNEIDRREIFQPRLNLAKVQWLFENKEHNKAVQEIEKFFNQKNKANNSLVNDFFELMRYGFSIKQLYNKDHPL